MGMKKLLALILAMSMALSCLCSGAFAAEVEADASAPTAEASVTEEETEAVPDLSQEADAPEEAETEAEGSDEEADAAPAEAPDEEDELSAQSEENLYVLMNIPYGEFYKAVGISTQVDAVSSATQQKTRSSLALGSYHVNSDGSDITGIIYPVKVLDPGELEDKNHITEDSSVTISVTMKGNTTKTTYEGKDALFEAPSYSFYILSEDEVPDAYMVLENGQFSAIQGEQPMDSTAEAVVKDNAHHTDIEIKVTPADALPEGSVVCAATVTTSEEKTYGLRHVVEIWRNGAEIGWNWTDMDGTGLEGKTLSNITYYTQSGGIYRYSVNTAIPGNLGQVQATFVSLDTVRVTGMVDQNDLTATVSSVVGKGETSVVIAQDVPVQNGRISVSNAVPGTNYQVTLKKDGYLPASARAVCGEPQTITAENVTKVFGSQAFSLDAKAQTALSYVSSNPKVVTVSASGLVTIKGTGQAQITITAAASNSWLEATKTITVTITKLSQTVYTASASNVTKAFGSKDFSLGGKAQTSVKYFTSNSKVVTVSAKGVVTIKGTGQAKITVTAAATDLYQAASKTITVTVTKGKQPLTVKPVKKFLKVNKNKAQTVKIKASNAQGNLTWKSSKQKVKVKNGKVTIPKGFKGTVKITVSAKGNKNYAEGKKVVIINVK